MPKRRKIVIYGINARGHSRPCLQLVRGLVKDGIEVDYLTPSSTNTEFAEAGANIVNIQSGLIDVNSPLKIENYGSQKLINSVKIRVVNDAIQNLPNVMAYIEEHKPDAFLSDKMCIAGTIAANHFSIPSANFHPTFCASHLFPGGHPTFDMPTDPEIIAEMERQIEQLLAISASAPATITALLGDHPSCNIAFFSKEFHPGGAQLDEGYHFVGPLLPEPKGAPPAERAGVYVSLGSIYGIYKDKFFRDCMEGLASLNEKIAISIANMIKPDYDLQDIPPNVEILREFNQVLQLEHLARSKAFITHGGMNSIQEAIWSETPMVVFPVGLSQEATGRNVERVQCGRKHVEGSSSPESIRTMVDEVMASEDIKHGLKTQHEFAERGGGVARAVSVLRELCA